MPRPLNPILTRFFNGEDVIIELLNHVFLAYRKKGHIRRGQSAPYRKSQAEYVRSMVAEGKTEYGWSIWGIDKAARSSAFITRGTYTVDWTDYVHRRDMPRINEILTWTRRAIVSRYALDNSTEVFVYGINGTEDHFFIPRVIARLKILSSEYDRIFEKSNEKERLLLSAFRDALYGDWKKVFREQFDKILTYANAPSHDENDKITYSEYFSDFVDIFIKDLYSFMEYCGVFDDKRLKDRILVWKMSHKPAKFEFDDGDVYMISMMKYSYYKSEQELHSSVLDETRIKFYSEKYGKRKIFNGFKL